MERQDKFDSKRRTHQSVCTARCARVKMATDTQPGGQRLATDQVMKIKLSRKPQKLWRMVIKKSMLKSEMLK